MAAADAFLTQYGITPDDLERALSARLADAALHQQMPWRVLAGIVPMRRWVELYGCDASVDGLLVPGAHELPPLATDTASAGDMALALWQASWRLCEFEPRDAAARCAMLLAQADWFPVVPAERPAATCQAAIVATNKRKSHDVRVAQAQWQVARGKPGLQQFVTDHCAPWLGVALRDRHAGRLCQWARMAAQE